MKKIAIVTGASGQLGLAFVETLLAMNYEVHGIDKIPGIHKCAHYFHHIIDITDEQEVEGFYSLLNRNVDVLVNNAGIGVFTPFEERTTKEFVEVMSVNLLGTFLMSREAIKSMKNNNGGSIINIGSIYGVVSSDYRIYGESGRNNSEVYSMTKAGVIQFARYVAANYGHLNIRMNCISPGGVYRNQQSFFVKEYINKTPMGRMANPEDFQSALKFLIDPDNKYTNGQNIVVDGGFSSW